MVFGARTTCKKVFLATVLFSVLSVPAFGEGGGADALFGLAAITSAASSAVVPAIQAAAGVSIANTNANASVQQAQIAADVSKYQAASVERTTMMQNMAALNINYENNRGQTDRLMLMLQEQAAARNQAYALKQDELREEYRLKRMELELADRQREENYKLAVMQMEAQRVAAGYATGFTKVETGLTTVAANRSTSNASNSTTSYNTGLLRGAARGATRVADRLLGFGFAGQGSTRAVRQKVSDLSAFQASVSPARSIASDEGLRRHKMREDNQRSTDQPGHR